MGSLNVKLVSWSLGLFGAISFVLCVAWGLLVPREWHATQLLEMGLPGFRWLSPQSFVLGLVESFVIGVYAGALFSLIYNFMARRATGAGR
jgi:hypothetical protein